jgi:nicotinamide-nucleotide amidase
LTLSITGIAGPGGSEHKEEGTVCFGLAIKNGSISSCTKYFGAIGRDNVRKKATNYAISLILQKLNEQS